MWVHFDIYESSNGQLKKFLFLVTAAILNGGQSEQKITTVDKDLARNISFMTIFNSILHVVSEKIFEISVNQYIMAPDSHIE
jgi:hypothetical protein